jgi:hypothetical protein
MTNEELFLKEGAAYFGNRLIYRNKDVGITAPGAVLVLTPEGEEIAARLRNITDVEAKPVRTRKPKVDDVSGESDTPNAE